MPLTWYWKVGSLTSNASQASPRDDGHAVEEEARAVKESFPVRDPNLRTFSDGNFDLNLQNSVSNHLLRWYVDL